MNRFLATMAILFAMLSAVAGAVYASDDPVYVMAQISYETGAFDTVLQSGRLTGGNAEESEYRIASVPLNSELEPMMTLPESDVLSALRETLSRAVRTDGAPFTDGDISLELAISDNTYAMAVRFNVQTQLDEITFYVNSLLTSNGTEFHWLLPIVRDLPVTILRVDDHMLDKLGNDISSEDLPEIGDFVMAHVSYSNDNYRIISIAMTSTSLVWFDLIESRDPADIYGELSDYDNTTDARAVSTPIPASYTVRPFALMSIEQRTQAWLDGEVEWVEPNCFTLQGECYRQGYNGESYGPGPFQLLIGTFLGATNVNDHFVLYIGFTAQNGERYFVPFNAGNYEVPNGFGVVIYDTPAIGQPGDMGVIVPWREGVGIDTALTSYAGSPTDIALLTGSIEASEAEFGQYVDMLGEANVTASADVASRFVFDVTVRGQSIENGPAYVNQIVNGENLGELPMIASMTFGRYI